MASADAIVTTPTTEEDVAAAKVQAIVRGQAARKEVQQKREEAAAAVKLQAAARGHQTRKSMQGGIDPGARRMVDRIITDIEQTAVASAITCTTEEHVEARRRKSLESGGSVGVDPAAAALVEGVVSDLEEQELAATKLQAVQRGRIARNQVKRMSAPAVPTSEDASGELSEDAAATKLQAVQRGRMTRKRMSNASADATSGTDRRGKAEAKEDTAATRVQAAARGRRDRKRAEERRRAQRAAGRTSPAEPDAADRSSTDLDLGSVTQPRSRLPSTRLPAAGGTGKSPRVTAHTLTPIKGGGSTPRGDLPLDSPVCSRCEDKNAELSALRRQVEALKERLSRAEGRPSTPSGEPSGSRRVSAPALVASEREMAHLRQENAELKKALQERDVAKNRQRRTRRSPRETA